MTSAEMILFFKLLYDVNGSQSVAGFTDEEIYGFINKAQEAMVTEYCSARDWDKVRELFGYARYTLTLTNTYGSDCYITEAVDPDYLYYITSRTQCFRSAYPAMENSEWFENYKIPMELIGNFQQNSANKGVFYNPRVVDVKQLLDVKQISTVTLTGSSGTCDIDVAGVATKTITFASSLPVTAANFVSANYTTYYDEGVVVSCNGDDLVFTALTAGVAFAPPVITPDAADLDGTVVETVSILSDVESNMFMVFVDRYTTASNLYLHYVKKPTAIADDTEPIIREELRRPIVEYAVKLAQITVADPRVMAAVKQQ
jgi:hypothetical protein